MISTLKKKLNKKGFTLAELLIVIAIIAILVAIAIPVFSTQLEGARKGVDQANARTAEALAVADYLVNHSGSTEEVTYKFSLDESKNLSIDADGSLAGTSTALKGTPLVVKVQSGKVTHNSWGSVLTPTT